MLFFPTVDEDFQYFRSQGYSGSLNDMHYKAMGDLTHTGSLTDRIHQFLVSEYGSFYEAMRDLRNSSASFIALRYGVLTKQPAYSLDFINEYYRAAGVKSNLNPAVTHSRAGNATMTDGYGAELVTNGTFDTDSDWTKQTGWTIGSGIASCDGTQNPSTARITQTLSSMVVGRTYRFSLNVTRTAGTHRLYGNGYQTSAATTTGVLTVDWVANSTSFQVGLHGDSSFVGSIDNVSVREIPAIKWAPHNLLSYSEDFSNSVWQKTNITASSSTTFTMDTSAGFLRQTQNIQNAAYTLKATISGDTDGDQFIMEVVDATDGSDENTTLVTVSSTPTEYTVTANLTPATFSGIALVAFNRSPSGAGVTAGSSITISNIHLYRSDLGGMVNNPETGDSYVRTAGRVIGSELVTNGTFATDSDWTKGTGVTISGGYANASSATLLLTQTLALNSGSVYKVSFDYTMSSGVSLRIEGAGILATTPTLSTSGVATLYITANSTTFKIAASGASFTGTIDNVSVKEVDVNPATARYLPRVGHHIYNGNAWVNEGVLHESEARTNIIQDSSNWTAGTWTPVTIGGATTTVTASSLSSPDGTLNAYEITGLDTSNSRVDQNSTGVTAVNGATWTYSVWLRGSGSISINVSTTTGTGGSNEVSITLTDTWVRHTATVTFSSPTGDVRVHGVITRVTGTAPTVHVYGAQLEAASTPSSYIPTSGSTVTRAAETLTVPAANMPWPTPVETTGTELVTNGTFATDLTGWNDISQNGGSVTQSSGVAILTTVASGIGARMYQNFTTVVGKLYQLHVSRPSGSVIVQAPSFQSSNQAGDLVHAFVATSTTSTITFIVFNPNTSHIDNVSVKEINPLSVSIQMDGRMTYADEGSFTDRVFFDWTNGTDFITYRVSGFSTASGKVDFVQKHAGVQDTINSSNGVIAEGVFSPFNLASRHGSTFINGAVDGTALTADTTPVALPDLSTTDLQLGYDFMGTIGKFRVWSDDLTDTGIATASAPSTEPSLQLTFDGSSTSSFKVLDWSE